MTIRRLLVGGVFLAIFAAVGCDSSGSNADPKVKSSDNAPKLQPIKPAGLPTGPAGAGKPGGPTPAPQ
jgi:hypothetical protein